MKRRMILTVGMLAATAWSGLAARAEDLEATVGGGVVVATSPYKRAGTKIWAIPLASLRYGPYFVQMGRGGAEVFRLVDGLSVSLFFDLFAGARYAVDGSDLPRGYDNIGDRKSQIAAGVILAWRTGWEDVYVSGSVAFGEEGNAYDLSVSQPEMWSDGDLVIIPKLSIGMLDGYYTRYYFGISDREARENDRIERHYQPGEALTLGASVYASYRLTDEWSILGMLDAEWLDRQVRGSPIVDRSLLLGAMIGASYTF